MVRGALGLFCFALSLFACGRVGFFAVPGAPDGPGVDDGFVDSEPPTCWSAWHAGTVQLAPPVWVAELASGVEDRDPSLAADGLTLYLARGNAQAADVYRATRTGPGSPFTSPVLVPELSSPSDDTRVTLSSDHLLVVLASARAGTLGGHDLWTATRGSVTDGFGTPDNTSLAPLNTATNDLDPHLSSDGLRLYFAPFTGNQRLVVAERAQVGQPFSAPVPIAELNTATLTADPALSPDDLVIAFAAGPTIQAYDLYYAVRPTRTSPFSTPRPLDQVNAVGVPDGDPTFSPDGCELFFASSRPGGAGGRDIWATRVQ